MRVAVRSGLRDVLRGDGQRLQDAPEDVVARLVAAVDVGELAGLEHAADAGEVLGSGAETQGEHDEHAHLDAGGELAVGGGILRAAVDGVKLIRAQPADVRLGDDGEGAVRLAEGVVREGESNEHLLEHRGVGGARAERKRVAAECRGAGWISSLERALRGIGEEGEARALSLPRRGGLLGGDVERLVRLAVLAVRLEVVARAEGVVSQALLRVRRGERVPRGPDLVRAAHRALDVLGDGARRGSTPNRLGRERERLLHRGEGLHRVRSARGE